MEDERRDSLFYRLLYFLLIFHPCSAELVVGLAAAVLRCLGSCLHLVDLGFAAAVVVVSWVADLAVVLQPWLLAAVLEEHVVLPWSIWVSLPESPNWVEGPSFVWAHQRQVQLPLESL